MNKTKKRQLNLKNKLIAAIAMLLVSSIMMVSTTYAWFTLSTAPEVQGITTTVGANGNLEIALANPLGQNSLITSGTSDSAKTWLEKNLTWGNLLDLSDEKYGLGEITLLPSQLNIAAGSVLDGSPLRIPVYGADGRIDHLDGSKIQYGAKDPTGTLSGFLFEPTVEYNGNTITKYPGYGVRALGTSSKISQTELNYRAALNAIESGRSSAFNTVREAMGNYGASLAEIAIMRKNDTAGTANYKSHMPNLIAMLEELDKAQEAVESGLYNALVAISNANIPVAAGSDDVVGDMIVTDDVTVRAFLLNNADQSMTVIWGNMPVALRSKLATEFPALVTAYNLWNETQEDVTSTLEDIKEANEADTVVWGDLSAPLSGLMDINNVRLNDQVIGGDINIGALLNGSGINIQLLSGSGVLANFGALTGDLSSQVTLGTDAAYGDYTLGGAVINLVTKSEPEEGAWLTQVRTTIAAIGSAEDDSEVAPIDVTYGYILDFVFRTNAANSNLLLQTEGIQRIYGENSNNAATMGSGSTITFGGTYDNLDSLINMMSGIRVVFKDTTGNKVYGIAKPVFSNTPVTMALIPATAGQEQKTGSTEFKIVYDVADDATPVMKDLLVSTTETASGVVVESNTLGNNTYIFKETVIDDATDTSYEVWTVKTAKWYKVITQTQKLEGENWVDLPATEEIREATNAAGEVLFFEGTQSFDATNGWQPLDPGADNSYPTDVTALNQTEWQETGDTRTKTTIVLATEVDGVNVADYYPKYYKVVDQDVSVAGDLYLHEYTIDVNGKLNFTNVLGTQTLTSLDQNVITGVSALVYLDGDYVDNGDVINSSTGISNSGKLNLQFASSAQLKPMDNTDLKNGESYDVTFANDDNATIYKTADKASKGVAYSFALLGENYEVKYKVGETGTETELTGQKQTYAGYTGYVYTIPADAVTDKIAVTITEKAPATTEGTQP